MEPHDVWRTLLQGRLQQLNRAGVLPPAAVFQIEVTQPGGATSRFVLRSSRAGVAFEEGLSPDAQAFLRLDDDDLRAWLQGGTLEEVLVQGDIALVRAYFGALATRPATDAIGVRMGGRR
jgi:hypothetical protein